MSDGKNPTEKQAATSSAKSGSEPRLKSGGLRLPFPTPHPPAISSSGQAAPESAIARSSPRR
jgi:hypothetical protein